MVGLSMTMRAGRTDAGHNDVSSAESPPTRATALAGDPAPGIIEAPSAEA